MKSSPSWVGQTVTLKCVADVVPTPTLTWKKPDGSEIKKVKATVNRADIVIRNDQDFGQYTCEVNNGAGSAATSIVQVQQISKYIILKVCPVISAIILCGLHQFYK